MPAARKIKLLALALAMSSFTPSIADCPEWGLYDLYNIGCTLGSFTYYSVHFVGFPPTTGCGVLECPDNELVTNNCKCSEVGRQLQKACETLGGDDNPYAFTHFPTHAPPPPGSREP